MASAGLRKELECSICMSVYTDPVTLRCGHSFCRDCINNMQDTDGGSGVYSCPECRATFRKWPTLQRNIVLCNIAENFLSTPSHQEEITGIPCTYCIHSPVPAVISCLHCEASLCDNHLSIHSKGAEHVLTDPSTSLKKWKCSVHKKILEYYCTEDAACICASCGLTGEHQGHQVEMLDEASEKTKKKLRNVLQKLITKREKTDIRVQSLEENRRKAQENASGEVKRVTALFIDIRKRVDHLEKNVLCEISRRKEQVSLSLSDVIQKLEIKKNELSKKVRHIEELCNMTDPLTVLQEADTGDLCDPEEESDEEKGVHDGSDEDTWGHDGDDLKTATWTEIRQNRLETPERFRTSLENRKCSVHKKILEYYCTEDAVCICVSCSLAGEHREHRVEMLDETSEKTKLRYVLQKLITKRKKTEEKVQSLEERRRKAQEKASGEVKRVTSQFIDIRRSVCNNLQVLHVDDLERKILIEISRWEEQEPDTGDFCDPEEYGGDEDTGGHDGGGQGAELISHMSHTLSALKDINVTFYLQDPADILLNVNSAEKPRRKAQEKAFGEVERVTALFIDIRSRVDDLEKKILSEISRRGEQVSLSLSDVIQKLEIEKDELSRKMRHIEELCNMTDPLTVLQDPDTRDLCDPEEDGGDEDTAGHDGGDRGAELISHIPHTLSDIIRGINVTLYGVGPVDILLDVNTAHNDLLISDDLKTATWTNITQNRPETAERFQYNQVMSRRGFTSGRHYWDVEISGSGRWRVGMRYPSIDRRGLQSYIGNNKSWGLYKGLGYNNQCSVKHYSNEIPLPQRISSDGVRICLDYEAGQLSFYELCDPIRHLHTFTAAFSEPLHAVLGDWKLIYSDRFCCTERCFCVSIRNYVMTVTGVIC
ncbi:uncharacterized protein ACNLHF_015243 [Anomaloglossus baeobatrachus]